MILGQILKQAVGHQRHGRDFLLFNIGALNRDAVGLSLDGQRLLGLLDGDAVDDSAIFHLEDRHAEVGGDRRARIQNVLQQVIEIPPVAAGQVRAGGLAATEQNVTVRAALREQRSPFAELRRLQAIGRQR